MKTLFTLLTFSLASIACSNAQSQAIHSPGGDRYFEAGLSALELRDGGQTFNPTGLRLLVGTNINRYLSLEAMYAFTLNADKQPTFDAQSEHFSIGLKPKVALNEATDVYARIGYGASHYTTSVQGSKTISDWTYGIGIQTNFTPEVFGQIDYMNFANRDGIWIRGVGLSLGLRFN